MSDTKASGAKSEPRTLVDEGTHLKGSLSSSCGIRVQGSVEGDVTAPAVSVTETGAVTGKVATSVLKSVGKLSGQFDVDTAQVAGTVGNKTVISASTIDFRLKAPRGKLELTFRTQGSSKS